MTTCPGEHRHPARAVGPARRAAVVGTGLIGGSVGMALRAAGWHVTGWDHDAAGAARALELGALDEVGTDPDAELTVVAVPVGAVAEAALAALAGGGVVTDVGSVKRPVVAAVDHPRFVGGHPMAGSEALGVDGARADLFDGAAWVLTPTDTTDPQAQALVHSVVRSLGADVVTLDPGDHDRLVATVSHVPHLTAATLMGLAADRSEEHGALLRLAAGGFRDMTRIAAGDPGIWLDICADNRTAILDVLDGLIESLGSIRVGGGRGGHRRSCATAWWPPRRPAATCPPELRRRRSWPRSGCSIPDRPGELAAATTLASELAVNLYDIEVAHAAGEQRGLLILVVAADRAADLAAALGERGRHASVHELA